MPALSSLTEDARAGLPAVLRSASALGLRPAAVFMRGRYSFTMIAAGAPQAGLLPPPRNSNKAVLYLDEPGQNQLCAKDVAFNTILHGARNTPIFHPALGALSDKYLQRQDVRLDVARALQLEFDRHIRMSVPLAVTNFSVRQRMPLLLHNLDTAARCLSAAERLRGRGAWFRDGSILLRAEHHSPGTTLMLDAVQRILDCIRTNSLDPRLDNEPHQAHFHLRALGINWPDIPPQFSNAMVDARDLADLVAQIPQPSPQLRFAVRTSSPAGEPIWWRPTPDPSTQPLPAETHLEDSDRDEMGM